MPETTRDKVAGWLFDQALPHWKGHGLDQTYGGFNERLAFAGPAATSSYKRLVVQARQIYVFSHSALIDPDLSRKPHWLAAAAQGFEFLQNYWLGSERGWAKSVTPHGQPLDSSTDTYDQAFVLLAGAWCFSAARDPGAIQLVRQTLEFLDTCLADPAHGGYFEGLSDAGAIITDPPRRQNPHMHLLEAMLALYQITGEPDYLARCARVFELFRTRFFDSETNTLGELFTNEWNKIDTSPGQCVEPGHHFEWTWLLHTYAKLSGDVRARGYANRLFGFAETAGLHGASGLTYDELNRKGAITRGSHRLWPQTEALKAFIAMAEHGPDQNTRDRARNRIAPAIQAIFDYYILPDTGIWQDQLDASCNPVSQFVPATSLYHLFLAFAETLRFYDANKSI